METLPTARTRDLNGSHELCGATFGSSGASSTSGCDGDLTKNASLPISEVRFLELTVTISGAVGWASDMAPPTRLRGTQ